IISPTANQTFIFGQLITVVSKSADPQGITRVDLLVNGKLLARISNLKPQTNQTLTASQVWLPEIIGNQVVQVIAYNAAAVAGESEFVFIQVLPATPTPPPASATPTPTPTYPYVVVTSADSLRVRTGPSTQYGPLGYLLPEQEARITGRNDIGAGLWWQIKFPIGTESFGWISSSPEYSTAYYTDTVPIVAAPPLPTPTASPTPSTRIDFRVDRTEIKRGECVTFSWNVSGVQAVYFQGKGVSGDNQSRRECPNDTTTYTLRIERTDGSEDTRSIQINVSADVASYNTSVLPREVKMDFDTGVQNLERDNEFFWRFDGDRPVFAKVDVDEPDIKLVALESGDIDSFNGLSQDTCRWNLDRADEDEITISRDLIVCFATDQNRIGKLRFKDGNSEEVVIEWYVW
ncbi:MAG: SH3 domain-containing protein, partial [Chloroflexi bacterium]|nr:SH3 domain-containing protein [Chloroflexota bacterium]